MAEQSIATKQAKQILKHYLRELSYYSGMRYGHDNDIEIEELVDLIIDAAVEKMKEELKNG